MLARAKDWEVRYTRDVVGNPLTVTDARGNAFTNSFYDSGELASTTRPSFWELEWPSDAANPDGGQRYTASDAADIEVATDGPVLREREGRSANAEQSGELPAKPESLGKGDLGAVDAQDLPGWLPQAGATRMRYDPGMRLVAVIDADDNARTINYDDAGRVDAKSWPLAGQEAIEHDFAYDPNGNVSGVTEDWDPSRVETSFSYDGYDRRLTEDAPGAHPSDPKAQPADTVREVTKFSYDANDNLVGRTTPRGTAFDYTYDSLDQLRSEANPLAEAWNYRYDRFGDQRFEVAPHGSGDEEAHFTTEHTFDQVSQRIGTQRTAAWTDRPPDRPAEDPQSLRWSFGYDDDGNPEQTTAPGAPTPQVSKVEHDARGLAWRTTLAPDTQAARVSITEHDANVRREINPKGVGDDGLPIAADDGTDTGANLEAASRDATVRT